MTKAVANVNLFDEDDALADIKSFGDALALLEKSGVAIVDSVDLGSGFRTMDKATLVKVPFIMLGYKFSTGTNGEFAIALVVTEEDEARKGIIVDGGSGIYAQLKLYADKGIQAIRFRDGLVRSDFNYDDDGVIRRDSQGNWEREPVGNIGDGTTYYLST